MTSIRKILSLLLIGYLTTPFAISCNNQISEGKPITKIGQYEFGSGLKIVISDDAGIVDYKLKDVDGRFLIQSKDKASVYQKWLLIWDGNRLWFSSSDIGTVVWVKNAAGDFSSQSVFKNSQLIKNVPDAIQQLKPSSMKPST